MRSAASLHASAFSVLLGWAVRSLAASALFATLSLQSSEARVLKGSIVGNDGPCGEVRVEVMFLDSSRHWLASALAVQSDLSGFYSVDIPMLAREARVRCGGRDELVVLESEGDTLANPIAVHADDVTVDGRVIVPPGFEYGSVDLTYNRGRLLELSERGRFEVSARSGSWVDVRAEADGLVQRRPCTASVVEGSRPLVVDLVETVSLSGVVRQAGGGRLPGGYTVYAMPVGSSSALELPWSRFVPLRTGGVSALGRYSISGLHPEAEYSIRIVEDTTAGAVVGWARVQSLGSMDSPSLVHEELGRAGDVLARIRVPDSVSRVSVSAVGLSAPSRIPSVYSTAMLTPVRGWVLVKRSDVKVFGVPADSFSLLLEVNGYQSQVLGPVSVYQGAEFEVSPEWVPDRLSVPFVRNGVRSALLYKGSPFPSDHWRGAAIALEAGECRVNNGGSGDYVLLGFEDGRVEYHMIGEGCSSALHGSVVPRFSVVIGTRGPVAAGAEGATVLLRPAMQSDDDRHDAMGVTDRQGWCTFANIPAGPYVLVVAGATGAILLEPRRIDVSDCNGRAVEYVEGGIGW